ncbi:MAG: DUF4340 domain-containing protein [Planctomycetes bacterium]|nr:DUF4340 domain-containing protein [Planctomycetota bacterium]
MSAGKTTLLLIALAIGLGAYVVYDFNHKAKIDDESFAWPLLRDFPAKDVTRIEIERELAVPRGPLKRERLVFEKDGKTWRMLEPLKGEAELLAINNLIEMASSMWPHHLLGLPANLDEYGLDANVTRLTLIHPQGSGTVLIGKASAVGGAVYAMQAGGKRVGLMDAGYDRTARQAAEKFIKGSNTGPFPKYSTVVEPKTQSPEPDQ